MPFRWFRESHLSPYHMCQSHQCQHHLCPYYPLCLECRRCIMMPRMPSKFVISVTKIYRWNPGKSEIATNPNVKRWIIPIFIRDTAFHILICFGALENPVFLMHLYHFCICFVYCCCSLSSLYQAQTCCEGPSSLAEIILLALLKYSLPNYSWRSDSSSMNTAYLYAL